MEGYLPRAMRGIHLSHHAQTTHKNPDTPLPTCQKQIRNSQGFSSHHAPQEHKVPDRPFWPVCEVIALGARPQPRSGVRHRAASGVDAHSR